MFGFIKKVFLEERLEKLDKRLAVAFERVRNDTSSLYSWVNYLREKDSSNDEKHQQVNYVLGNHTAMIKALQQEILELKKTAKNELKIVEISPETNLVRTKFGPENGVRSSARKKFEKNVIRKVTSRRKEYVVEHILKLINKREYSTSEIENIVVNEKVLCGRTAFYDYLRELRYKRTVRQGRINGKPTLILAENR